MHTKRPATNKAIPVALIHGCSGAQSRKPTHISAPAAIQLRQKGREGIEGPAAVGGMGSEEV